MTATVTAVDRPAAAWPRAAVLLLAALAGIVVLHLPTAVAMVTIWERSDTFAHAYLVLPISLWLVWRQRAALALLTPRPSPAMLALLAVAAFVWLLSDLAAVNAGAQFAFVAMLVIAVPAVLGLQVARALMFPLGFLFFMVPFGEFTMNTLMAWTADFVVTALQLSGIPVYREGLQFVIPSGNWSVVEACSGVRYLIASVMVGTLFAYINYTSLRRRWMFVGVAILVPVIANWLRAYMIVMLGHLSGNKLAVGADHLIYGWVFFGVVILIMFTIGARWSEEPFAPAAPVAGPDGTAASPAWVMLAVAAAAVVIGALPLQALRAIVAAEPTAAPQLGEPSLAGARPVEPFARWKPAYQQPRAEMQRSYVADGATAPVGVYIAYYRHQGGDSKLVNSQNSLAAGKDSPWSSVATEVHAVEVDGRTIRMRGTRLLGRAGPDQPGDQRLLVSQVYWVDGQLTGSDLVAKLLGAKQRLLGGGDDAAVVIFYAVDDGKSASAATLEAFARAQLPAITAQLAKVRRGG